MGRALEIIILSNKPKYNQRVFNVWAWQIPFHILLKDDLQQILTKSDKGVTFKFQAYGLFRL